MRRSHATWCTLSKYHMQWMWVQYMCTCVPHMLRGVHSLIIICNGMWVQYVCACFKPCLSMFTSHTTVSIERMGATYRAVTICYMQCTYIRLYRHSYLVERPLATTYTHAISPSTAILWSSAVQWVQCSAGVWAFWATFTDYCVLLVGFTKAFWLDHMDKIYFNELWLEIKYYYPVERFFILMWEWQPWKRQ